jgi:gliding motility-associated-like protein
MQTAFLSNLWSLYGKTFVMKCLLSFSFLFLLGLSIQASHITGGEMIYQYKAAGSSGGNKMYTITLRLFRDENCANCAAMPTAVTIGAYNNDTRALLSYYRIPITSSNNLPLNPLPPCITNPPVLNYSVGYFTFDILLPDNNNGYTLSYQTCCRIQNIQNINDDIGATYTASIPGNNSMPARDRDHSPQFAQGISVVCHDRPFTLDFSAMDSDNDSLVYTFCGAYDGGGAVRGNANPSDYTTPAGPPFSLLQYTGGYSGTSPLGGAATINPATGIISGIAPSAGKYVVSVCVNSYDRNTGRLISTHRKDFIITVAPCDLAGAQLEPNYISCDGFTFNFQNLNPSPLNVSFFWDFGDGNTSTDPAPTHTYATAGVYTLKLVVNRGDPCADSTTSQLRVFPGFFPAFNNMSPVCNNVPLQFSDATTANYGSVNSWSWNFGDGTTSTAQNPLHTYFTPGNYNVSLVVGSSVGCIDTLVKTVEVLDKAPYTLTNDTLICNIDTLQLNFVTVNPGNITWTPNYMISSTSSFNPLVSPDVSTTYYVSYSDNFGCSATDSVRVNVVDRVSLNAMPDTTICTGDTVLLRINSDGLQYTWTPPATLNNASIQSPTATPTAPLTTYHVIARIGKCFTEEDIVVRTVPYPVANAGLDTTICFGDSYQLSASGGSIYSWTPRLYLNNSNIPNPISQQPPRDMQYIVEVRDVLGCPKPVYDTMQLFVAQIIADAGPADTNVVLNQPLQLNATGSSIYAWSPATWLNNPTIANPLAFPQESIQYVVRVSNPQGCFDTDTINVKVFKIDPDLLVPTGFSPDNDGINDVFRPIVIGMKSLDAFRVYNRWGQLVFSTTQTGFGWDGDFKGMPQGAGTYVWYASGITYLGKKIEKKGTVILIR